MKIGVITDCLKKATLEEDILCAKKLGFSGVQIYATQGKFSADMTSDEKAVIKNLLKENNLEVSALCGDMGGYGFEIAEDNPERIEKTKRIIDLAKEFGAKVVTTHIGVIPADRNCERYKIMLDALTQCGLYAKEQGVTMAIETGPERATTLKMFVEDTLGGVGVNLDPANFTMVTGQDAVEAVHILAKHIVHTHVKDGRKLNDDMTPEQVYHGFAVGGVDALNACKSFIELPIGEGDVDWTNYLKALKEIGYDGYLTVEREAGDQPEEDIKTAIEFIKSKLK